MCFGSERKGFDHFHFTKSLTERKSFVKIKKLSTVIKGEEGQTLIQKSEAGHIKDSNNFK